VQAGSVEGVVKVDVFAIRPVHEITEKIGQRVVVLRASDALKIAGPRRLPIRPDRDL
jgi:hypothetical protein